MYKSKLDFFQTEQAIKEIKDTFQQAFSQRLHLMRVSAPLFVEEGKGINDQLNGIEEAVTFFKDEKKLEIVQSLAKWKRLALKRYGFRYGQGLFTDMNAIRKDEILSPIHSLYVDQWDWELIINNEERSIEFLKSIVLKIYQVFLDVESKICETYSVLDQKLPKNIYFITSEELEKRYPKCSSKEREDQIAKVYGAVFIIGIGDILSSGQRHDTRSPDYDDWQLNGDLIFWNPVLNHALEMSSMGIRVDQKTLKKQLEKSNELKRMSLYYHQMIDQEVLPLTIGGGIGQSRMCMFLLDKKHIGEVQVSYWPDDILESCRKDHIHLL